MFDSSSILETYKGNRVDNGQLVFGALLIRNGYYEIITEIDFIPDRNSGAEFKAIIHGYEVMEHTVEIVKK